MEFEWTVEKVLQLRTLFARKHVGESVRLSVSNEYFPDLICFLFEFALRG